MKAYQILEGTHKGTIYFEDGIQARIIVSKTFKEDSFVDPEIFYGLHAREIEIEQQPTVKIEGGQHLNVNVLRRETLEDAVKHNSLTPEQQRDVIARTFTESL